MSPPVRRAPCCGGRRSRSWFPCATGAATSGAASSGCAARVVTDYELIVVDDGSTDDSAATAREAGATLLRLPTPRGPAAARNLGAQAASSPLIFFLDADVAVHPETLARALGPIRPRSVALRPLRLVRRSAGGARAWSASIATCSIISSTSRVYFRDGIRPAHTFWTGCGAIGGASFSSTAVSTHGFIPAPRSKTSSWATGSPGQGTGLCWRTTFWRRT